MGYKSEIIPIKPISFACPKCKRPLLSGDNVLQCHECNRMYPIAGGIPDFISGDAQASLVLQMAKKVDLLAPIYESRLWYSFLLKLAGAGGSSLDSIASFHSETLRGVSGSVLDVACGTATYGRRIASPSRSVYGIDISMGMLQQGKAYNEWYRSHFRCTQSGSAHLRACFPPTTVLQSAPLARRGTQGDRA